MLATPVQYEPALEQLNEIRPLILPDDVKQEISISVGCVNPPTKNRPAVGKLLRCIEQGALAVKNAPPVFGSFVLTHYTFDDESGFVWFDVSPNCKGVVTYLYAYDWPLYTQWWCKPDETLIMDLGYEEYKWIPFTGDRIYFNASHWLEEGELKVWRFY